MSWDVEINGWAGPKERRSMGRVNGNGKLVWSTVIAQYFAFNLQMELDDALL